VACRTRAPWRLLVCGAVFACLSLGAAARAETRRLAIVAGNNIGAAGRPVLRFAEADAYDLAHTLTELGGVAPDDLFLLEGRSPDDIRRAFEAAKARADEWHRLPNVRIVLIVYFSGHSDGESFELGDSRLAFRELRDRTARVGADLRLIIADSCKSGSLLTAKGGSRGPSFDIHIADDLPESGEAVITSSAANESSLESAELGGSFFTHHLVSGLRGAADTSGDGRVSLAEAYQYAFDHTTWATSNTLGGIQHPSYGYLLSGEGDLVLTELHARSAGLTVPAGYDRVLVRQVRVDHVIAELTSGSRTRLALSPGTYAVTVWKGQDNYVARVALAEREERVLAQGELAPARPEIGVAKGPPVADLSATGAPAASWPRRPWLTGAAGVTSAASGGLGTTMAARVGLRSSMTRGFEIALDGALRSASNFDEYRSLLLAGYRVGARRGRWLLSGAVLVGAGVVGQRTATDSWPLSFAAAAVPTGALAWRMNDRAAIGLELEATVAVYRRDFNLTGSIWPGALVGITVAP